MRALIAVVGQRTEHWEGFFAALARRDIEVTVVAADVTPLARRRLEDLAESHPRFRIRVVPHMLSEARSGHMASVLFRPGWSRALRAEPAPDVVYALGEPGYLSTLQTIRFRNRFARGAPVALFAAQNVVTHFPRPFPQIEQYAYRQAALALPVTPAALAVLREKGFLGPARIVPLGVDLDRFRPHGPPAGPFTIGFVGRLEPHKGIDDLLAASRILGCKLLVVGDGSLRPLVEEEQRRRPDDVEFLRWVDHERLPGLLGRMHALAFPSLEIVQRNLVPWVGVPLREQFGRVLTEAMACGVPVVANDVGEIGHVLGGAGITVEAGDPAALARGLATVRDRPELVRALRRAGIARAPLLSWARIADDVHETWSRLVTQPGESMSRAA
jgi:glycosyltransferase involved in cell wall biosynthesis